MKTNPTLGSRAIRRSPEKYAERLIEIFGARDAQLILERLVDLCERYPHDAMKVARQLNDRG